MYELGGKTFVKENLTLTFSASGFCVVISVS